ncbi:MFS transporter [Galbibacter mesophilus]|uniref:MFS transporter n=1 Tax=Galbibacter mesophilus TaxID=379069 RepID=UPI00191CA41B|nr:MFS transporter [Galbibacter mesophilus]MCM5661600.1 MFS transporter [Galbibacter mesophilus]
MNALKLILTNKKYFAPAWVFASLNILFGTWAIYIPTIKSKLEITEGQLGIALFFFALGTLVFIPIAPLVIKKLGVGHSTFLGIVLYAVLFLLPFLAPSYLLLAVSLFIVGASSGLTDIVMNTLVSEVEREDNITIMSATHGFFSLGGVIGAGVGSLLKLFIETPWVHMLCVIIFVVITNLLLFKFYKSVKGTVSSGGGMDLAYLKPLFGLCVIGFLILASEGAIADWSSLYLKNVTLTSSTFLIGLGYTLFSATMTCGRFFGDFASDKYGALKIINVGVGIGVVGYLLILTANTFLALLGFGLVGLGFSVIIPELFRLAGKVDGVEPAKGISFIAGISFVGFLTGPVILGFLADLSSLRLSFTALLVAAIIVFFTSYYLRKKND